MFKVKRILIADDHPLFREALLQAITNHFGPIEILSCGSFSGLQEKIKHNDELDLILLDLHMPGAVGFSTLHYLGISFPQLPVAIISANEKPQTIARALKLGASGFIPKSSSIENIVKAIEKILQGEVWLPEDNGLQVQAIEELSEDFLSRLEQLTPKQFRVLMMLVEGRTNNEIANESFVTIATIKAHLSEIFRKLEVNNRTQAAMMAANYLEIDDPNTQTLT